MTFRFSDLTADDGYADAIDVALIEQMYTWEGEG